MYLQNFGIDKSHVFIGRQTLYTSRTPEQINADTIPDVINGAMQRHIRNRQESLYLKKYFRGWHPILDRVKNVRPDINNRLVINNAFSIVRNSVGYFLGEPIQFTARKEENADAVTTLNDYMDSEDKSGEDMSIGNDGAITGRGFRLIAADQPEFEDEAPFEIPTLEAQNTEVIYSTEAGRAPLLGFTHAPILDDNGNEKATEWTVYDRSFQYIYVVPGSFGTQLQRKHLIKMPMPHFLGDVPIVEYPNNEWRIGDFEIVLTILDAIDKLQSDRVNSVEQIVSSILVFVGCHLRTKKEKNNGEPSDYEKLQETYTLEIPADTNGQHADVKYVSCNVDQNEAETLTQTLMDYVYAISGIPDRKDRSNGGGDTGDAVYLRDGFQSLELVARTKERNFRKSERRSLRMICEILRRFDNMNIRPIDLDIKFIRNRTDNLLNKSQAFSDLMSTKQIAPVDGISLIGITNDPKGMAERGQKYWDSEVALASAQADNKTLGEGENPDDTTDGEE